MKLRPGGLAESLTGCWLFTEPKEVLWYWWKEGCIWDTPIYLSLGCCHSSRDIWGQGRVGSQWIGPSARQWGKLSQGSRDAPSEVQGQWKYTYPAQFPAAYTTLTKHLLAWNKIPPLFLSRYISPWNSNRGCCICSHHGPASAPGGWGLS